MEQPGLAIFDFDGTIADTMGELAAKAERMLSLSGLTMGREEARERYLATSGIPFSEQFDTIHPNAPRMVRENALRTFEQHKLSTLATAKPVKGAETSFATLRELYWDSVIISSTDRELVEWWLRRNDLDLSVDRVRGYGKDGTKDEQLDEQLGRPHRIPVVYIGDSVSDYTRARDRNIDFIGIAGVVTSEFMWRSLNVPYADGIKYVSDVVKELYI